MKNNKIEVEENKMENKADEIDPSSMKEAFTEIGKNSKEDGVISDLFYNSVKLLFDIGFDLARKLDFELVEDSIRKATKTEKK